MKNLVFALLVSALFMLNACKEVGPDINLHGNQNSISDTTYIETPVATPEAKNVYIEDFTGVRCPNCPQGHVIIGNIKAAYPGRIVSISLHPINSLGTRYPFSTQDLEDQKSQTLFDYLQQIGFEPAGGIDRKLFGGETNILLDKSKWANYAAAQTGLTTPVNIDLTKTYDSVTRQLKIVTELHYTQNVTEGNDITIALTESNIVSAQLNGLIIDTFYVHNDVLRDIITSTQGDGLTQELTAGRVIRKIYQTTLNSAWKPENMNIVTFVHETQNAKTVYQVKELKVTD